MLNLKDFDYILWKDGEGRCFVKVKFTDEVTEVSEQVFKDLRNEEKRIYRELELKDKLYSEDEEERAKASVMFPSSYFSEIELEENESESFVLEDMCNFEDEVICKDLEEKFEGFDISFGEFDDIVVRRIIDCIKVVNNEELLIIVKGGLEIKEKIHAA